MARSRRVVRDPLTSPLQHVTRVLQRILRFSSEAADTEAMQVALRYVPSRSRLQKVRSRTPETANTAGEVRAGNYVVNSADGVYVVESGNISYRLGQHVRQHMFTPEEVGKAGRQAVTGGRTQRQIAEQTLIDRMGGIHSLLNVRNPIGKKTLAPHAESALLASVT